MMGDVGGKGFLVNEWAGRQQYGEERSEVSLNREQQLLRRMSWMSCTERLLMFAFSSPTISTMAVNRGPCKKKSTIVFSRC